MPVPSWERRARKPVTAFCQDAFVGKGGRRGYHVHLTPLFSRTEGVLIHHLRSAQIVRVGTCSLPIEVRYASFRFVSLRTLDRPGRLPTCRTCHKPSGEAQRLSHDSHRRSWQQGSVERSSH